jgi:hypothetical protein
MEEKKKTAVYFQESAGKKYGHLPEGPKENELTDKTEESFQEEQESIIRKSKIKVICLSAAALLLSAILIFILWSFLKQL